MQIELLNEIRMAAVTTREKHAERENIPQLYTAQQAEKTKSRFILPFVSLFYTCICQFLSHAIQTFFNYQAQ